MKKREADLPPIDSANEGKICPSDFLGALNRVVGISCGMVGKIDTFGFCSYFAVDRPTANQAIQRLQKGKIKGPQFRGRKLHWAAFIDPDADNLCYFHLDNKETKQGLPNA